MIRSFRRSGTAGTKPSRPGNSGTAAIEFAIIAPVLISMLLGVCDLAPTLMVKFKVGTATQAVADLATQSSTMQASDIANFFAIGADVMAPFSANNLVLRVTNIASDGNGNAFVYWSCGNGSLLPFIARSSVTSTPTGTPVANLVSLTRLGLNTSYVMVETRYSYTAPASFILRTAQLMTGVSYTMPRVSTYIGPTTGDANYVPTPPASTRYNYPVSTNGVTCNIGI